MEKIFKIGDTVQLKSGGPLMTVTEHIESMTKDIQSLKETFQGEVECTWFIEEKAVFKTFHQDTLEKVQK